MSIAFVFPGQGSQTVGMGREFIENFSTARHVMQEVDDHLSQKLTTLILEGPLDKLTLTENAQPALLAISLAILKTLEQESGQPVSSFVSHLAGHSLGEYTALCAAGVLDIAQAVRLVRIRGQAMQTSVPVGKGSMAAILGLDIEAIEQLLAEFNKPEFVCVVANDNAPGQVVISGHTTAVDQAIAKANDAGAKRAIALTVSGPFHSPLMQPAADVMRTTLEQVILKEPTVPVLANVTAMPVIGTQILPDLLVQQVTGRVRWRETILNLAALNCYHVIEIGAGKVLTGLNKRIAPSLQATAINTPHDLEGFLKDIP